MRDEVHPESAHRRWQVMTIAQQRIFECTVSGLIAAIIGTWMSRDSRGSLYLAENLVVSVGVKK
jgi:hypothetical protein